MERGQADGRSGPGTVRFYLALAVGCIMFTSGVMLISAGVMLLGAVTPVAAPLGVVLVGLLVAGAAILLLRSARRASRLR